MTKTNVDIFFKDKELLYLRKGGKEFEVHVRQCFPWSMPRNFLSLRDNQGKELHLVEDIEKLDETSRNALDDYLSRLDFVIEIKGINDILEDVELRQFDVNTADGQRVFFTELDEWPVVTSDGRIIIEDLSGDVYHISDPAKLDKKSRKLLSTYVS